MLLLAFAACGDPDPACVEVAAFLDEDGDGYGAGAEVRGCEVGPGHASVDGDCDDVRPTVHPGAVPACDDVPDDDCDGLPDPSEVDDDGDGKAECAGDCDDADADRWTCGSCPDVADYSTETFFYGTYNPCLIDPATEAFCSPDPTGYPDTLENAQTPHRVAYRTDLPLRPQLFLWLPPGEGDFNLDILNWAAWAGYRVVSLGHLNRWFVGCLEDAPLDCYLPAREELTFGTDTSPDVDIAAADSVSRRLVALLGYLEADQPGMGWADYVDPSSGEPRWERIVVAAFSDAVAGASVLARDRSMFGVLEMGGPLPIPGTQEIVPYLADPLTTPTCAIWGFRHELEEDAPSIDASWDDQGLTGAYTLVESGAPPFAGTHRLGTASYLFEEDTCTYHGAVARDPCLDEAVLQEPYTWLFCEMGNRDLSACPL
jgi:hypothetical protein